MTRKPPSPELAARVREIVERRLTPDEIDAALRAPMSAEEREEIRSLISWFTRRYPTPAERLAYARRAYARWTRALDPPEPAGPPR